MKISNQSLTITHPNTIHTGDVTPSESEPFPLVPLAAPREAVEVYIEREREGETFPLVPLAAPREAVEVYI